MSDVVELKRELAELRSRADVLQREIAQAEGRVDTAWAPRGFYADYHATTGFLLGGVAALISLIANILGAPFAGKGPLELIRVYLTFPLGERALQLSAGSQDVYLIPDGMILAMGCCLYLGTGMLIGVPFFVVIMALTGERSLTMRLIVATLVALLVWFINFYLLLSWLQPLLFGGRWITDPTVLPPWVAAATHVLFGWTLAVIAPWGRFVPYEPPVEAGARPVAG
jgi:hypothetical protein